MRGVVGREVVGRGMVGWEMWGVVWRLKCQWVQAMEPVMPSSPWSDNAQHLMFLMHTFGLTGLTEVIVWTHYTFEANSKNVLVTTVTDNARVSRARLF